MSITASPAHQRRQDLSATAGGAVTTTTRHWTLAGIGAAVAGIGSIVASMQLDAVYDESIAGDAAAIKDRLAEQTPQLIAFHLATIVSALLLLVAAAGLRRRLRDALPAGSLLPQVAGAGLLLVSVAGLMGSGLDTEFIFGVKEADLVPETAVFFGHWVGTIAWLWVGAGVAGICVAVAALRHRAAARWVGLVSAVLGGLTLLLGISPLQYMAGMVGPVWLLIVMVGFARERVTPTV